MWKYLVLHHRVRKTDALLKRVLLNLAYSELTKDTPQATVTPSEMCLQADISGLWAILKISSQDTTKELNHLALQWDDALLLSLLRKHYFELRNKEIHDEEKKLLAQLEELITNRKNYVSIFKRSDSFRKIDRDFWMASSNDENKPLSGQIKQLIEEVKTKNPQFKPKRAEHLLEQFSERRKIEYNSTYSSGFFLNLLFELLGCLSKDTVKKIFEMLEEKIKNDQYVTVADCVIAENLFKKAPLNTFEILSDENLVKIDNVSSIVKEIDAVMSFIPPFYIYVFPKGNVDDFGADKINKIKDAVGQYIYEIAMELVSLENKKEKSNVSRI